MNAHLPEPKIGFKLDDVDAVTRARLFKPSIPLFSDQGILIKDELTFSFLWDNAKQ